VRILYGVAGEGMGHATRSQVFLADLVGEHDVLVVASGRAHDYLAQHFPQVREILGFSLSYEDNTIRRWETVLQNLRGAVGSWPAVLAAVAERGEHLLVYQTAAGSETLVRTLHRAGLPCRLYGVRRDLEEDLVDGDLVYRPFSETDFLDDLRTARAVIAGGGFSLLSECVYLHKPVLSLPVTGQFEQVLNARYLERLGYGAYAEAPTPEAIGAFLEHLQHHERALAGYVQDGNNEALAALREQLALVALARAGGRRRDRRPPEPAA
jgi:UDP:flavonoid glycosyltransferase YjiC (YdhE family)